MFAAFEEIVQQLPKKCPQCYSTSYEVFDKMSARDIKNRDKRVSEGTLDDFVNISDEMVGVVEISINIDSNSKHYGDPAGLRHKYKIKNTFWIPRVFLHAFNIVVNGPYVDVWQSWFRVSDYALIWRMPRDEFPGWIRGLNRAINNFGNDPAALFNMFEYEKLSQLLPKNSDVNNLYKLIVSEKFKLAANVIVKIIHLEPRHPERPLNLSAAAHDS